MKDKKEYMRLKKEIDDMLSILSGDWDMANVLMFDDTGRDVWYFEVTTPDHSAFLVFGKGYSKTEALRNTLDRWGKGHTGCEVPAANSAEELRLKLAVKGQP